MARQDQKPTIHLIEEKDGLRLGDRFTIDTARPLGHLSKPGAQAFAVADDMENPDEYFCLLCEPTVYIRHAAMELLATKQPRHVRLPLASGTVRMNDGRHFTAIVFDNAGARPILEYYGKDAIPERDLTQKVLPDLINALSDMNPHGLCHRGIRPENILITPDGQVILDQFVLHLPGETQPAAYEPVLSAFASAGGRGEGTAADDFYALGVAALHLVSGKLPAGNLSPEELLASRVMRGSYVALLQRRKYTSALQALFSGVFADEAHRRWSIENLRGWAGGHWDTARPTAGGRRASRPFLFMNRDYYCPELLAWAFFGHQEEARQTISAGRVGKWVRNVLEDNQAADIIDNACSGMKASDRDPELEAAELITRICFALDPGGPLRYRDLVVPPTGIAGALWTAFIRNDEAQLASLEQLLSSTLLGEWQATGSRVVRAALPNFVTTTIKSIMVERSKPGFGLERVLYEMLPRTACLEENVRDALARNTGELMLALDRIAEKDADAALRIGRHAAAFIMAKDKNAETTIRALGAQHATRIEELIAIGDLLAYLQRNYYQLSVPSLSKAMGTALTPAADAIRSRVRRMVVSKKIETLSSAGDMTAFSRDLSMKETLRQDEKELKQARHRLGAIDQLIRIASSNGPAQAILAQKRGYRYARLFSMSVSFLTVFYFSMVEML
ncbi:hypothetical protein [Minwuia sp.]|uniref:hypothetical protein n=1 Tax=Minwuia sp. TaxID=2493630 RepID=UPI003A917297